MRRSIQLIELRLPDDSNAPRMAAQFVVHRTLRERRDIRPNEHPSFAPAADVVAYRWTVTHKERHATD
jgi:hypothetical protein